MTREKYVVVNASSEENQNGVFHYSTALDLEDARKIAAKIKDDFVVIEKRLEEYNPAPSGFVYRKEDYGWELLKSEVID